LTSVASRSIASDMAACEQRMDMFLSAFPMFVLSLSW
jgi:hypothetical protein